MTRRIVALVPDLFVSSRIAEAARRAGMDLDTVEDVGELTAALAAGADLLIVDLGVTGLDLDAISRESKAHGVPIAAFGPHVEAGLLEAAKASGMENIYRRGTFLRDLHTIVSEGAEKG